MIKLKSKVVSIKDIVYPKKYNVKRDGITQGLIMCFLKCRREFLLRINGWGTEENKKSFANGSITHDTLDKVYTFYKKYKKLPGIALIKKWINTYNKSNKSWLGPAHKEDAILIKALAFVIVTEYIRYYKKDFEEHEIIGAEDIFDIYWNGFRLRGKKDLRFKIHEKIWIMETKTSARIDESELAEKITFDFQSLFYTICEELEFGHEVAGVIYNVIRNPGHKLGSSETIFQFQNRLRKEIRKNPTHFFKRWSIPFTKSDKDEFKKELIWKLEEIYAFQKGILKTYKNEKNCVARFRCIFLKACASGQLIGYTNTHKLFKELEEGNNE